MPKPSYADRREARAFERKLNGRGNGSDELRPPDVEDTPVLTAADRKALESEGWYQDYLRLRNAKTA